MPWLSRQKPKAGVHSELGSARRMASAALPARSQAPGPCDCSDAAPALAVRTTADGRALSGALLRHPAAATPAVRAPCSRAQPRPPGRSRREPQPPGTTPARRPQGPAHPGRLCADASPTATPPAGTRTSRSAAGCRAGWRWPPPGPPPPRSSCPRRRRSQRLPAPT